MKIVTFEQAAEQLAGKSVAVVGSAPSVLENEPGFVDSHDVVVRVNNYKTGAEQGQRCDVFYSFFGASIRKNREELVDDGVRLCMCKCPDAKPIESEWHERNGKQRGIDFRYIYNYRRDWWFCDTYIPTPARFMETFKMLNEHIASTGFAAIVDVIACKPKALYLTGFDFFASGVHNVDEKWRPGDPSDPIGHRPRLEANAVAGFVRHGGITMDATLQKIVQECYRVMHAGTWPWK